MQSLNDTPEVFGCKQSRDVDLRMALKQYLGSQEAGHITQNPGYSVSNVASRIKEGDLCLLDVFDVFQDGGFTFYTERRRCKPPSANTKPPSTGSATALQSPRTPCHETSEAEPTFSTYENVLQTLNDSVCVSIFSARWPPLTDSVGR